MEEGKKSVNGTVIFMLILILLLGGFIIYDKVLKKDNITNNTTDNNETNSNSEEKLNTNINHLLSLVIIKRDSKGQVVNYKISDLKDEDYNDIISSYIIQDENAIKDADSAFQMKAIDVEEAMKALYNKTNFNVSSGMNIFGIHTLSTVDVSGTKYYRVVRKDGVPFDIPNDDSYYFGKLNNINYTKNGELIIECDVQMNYTESPIYELLGNATIKFDISNGIRFVSFDFKKANTVETFSSSPIME